METLCKYKMPELRQLAIYMEIFQDGAFVPPKNIKQKKGWLNTTYQMISQKGLEDPTSYIFRLRTIIRWFIDHKFKFQRNMLYNFCERLKHDFLRNVTTTHIHLEDRDRNSIDIDRSDIILPDYMITLFDRVPNTMNNRLFYNDDILARRYSYHFLRSSALQTPQIQQTLQLPQLQPLLNVSSIIDEEVTEETRVLECKVCLFNKVCIVLSSCGHAFCNSCISQFENRCATCRSVFSNHNRVRLYI